MSLTKSRKAPAPWDMSARDQAVSILELSRGKSSVIIFCVSLVAFGNSINADFVFDDSEAILNNKDVQPETPVWNLLWHDFWGTPLTHNQSHKSYRPVTVLTFRWNCWMAGGLHPFVFHLTNVILHGIVSTLVLHVADRLFERKSPRLSILTAILFAVHPVHTEAVAGVVGRADLLSAFFSFLSFLVYAMAAENSDFVGIFRTVCTLVVSMILCALALFSKEQGITIIGICSAYDLLILNKCQPLKGVSLIFSTATKSCMVYRLKPGTTSHPHHILDTNISCAHKIKVSTKKMTKSLFLRQGALIVSGTLMLAIRWHIMDSKPPNFQKLDNPASFAESFWTRVFSYNYIYTLNAWLLLCPEWLCFDWSMGCVPLISNIHDVRLISVVIFYSVLFSLLYRGLFSSKKCCGRNIIMAVVVTLSPFLPASNLFFQVGFVLAERVLYVPALGVCMLVVLGMEKLLNSVRRYGLIILFMYGGLILLYCLRCIHRSSEWHDEKILFSSCLPICPLNAKVHYNVAKNAGDLGNYQLAVKEYKIALDLNPQYEQAMNNLANILRHEGELLEAELLLKKALTIRPDFPAAWMNLGIVLASMKRYNEAEQSYHAALALRAIYPDCFYNLGNLYLDRQMYHEAYLAWRNATFQRPSLSLAWNNMVILLESKGDPVKAEAVAMEGLSFLPKDPGLHFNLGNVLGKTRRYQEAEQHFSRAIELDPHNPVYHANMGVLYHKWKKYDLAEKKYKAALLVDPQMKSASTNLAMLKRGRLKE